MSELAVKLQIVNKHDLTWPGHASHESRDHNIFILVYHDWLACRIRSVTGQEGSMEV